MTLAIDTSGDLCSVSLGTENQVLDTKTVTMPHGQSGVIFSLLESLQKDTPYHWHDVGVILVNRGPGSFTGLRTGLSVAKGLSLGHDMPIKGFTAFDICRAHSHISAPLFVFLKTRRGDYYGAEYQPHSRVFRASIWSADDVKNYINQFSSDHVVTDCDVIKVWGGHRFQSTADRLCLVEKMGKNIEIQPSSDPFYMRDPEIHVRPKS